MSGRVTLKAAFPHFTLNNLVYNPDRTLRLQLITAVKLIYCSSDVLGQINCRTASFPVPQDLCSLLDVGVERCDQERL